MLGLEQSLGSRIVTYADDLVILCRKGKAAAKPILVPRPIADETKPEPPRTVRVIQIYKTSDQLPVETTQVPVPVEPISAFPETTTMPLPETLPSSLPTPPPPQKTAVDFCGRFHLHKVFTNNGKSWRCMK
jgi:hypothetical protein